MASPTIHPVSGALGAEVRGLDLRTISDEEWDALHALWLQHLVLFFPDQRLDADAHVRLARRLGEPEIHPFSPKLDGDHPEIMVLDGVKTDTFHTDVTFSPTPPLASVLHNVVCPAVGGDTIWTNQHLAYEQLSPPMRDLLDGLTAVHTAAPMGQPQVQASHPVVRVHPETGRRCLFVNRGFTSHIVELRRAESDALLEYLYAWSEQPNFQCRYRWSAGTVAIWDNRCTEHYGVWDYEDDRRLERVTILGDEPVGPPSRWTPFQEEIKGEVPTPLDERANSIAVDA